MKFVDLFSRIPATSNVDAESWFRGKGCKYAEVHAHAENHHLRAMFKKRGYAAVNRDRDAIWSWVVLRRDL